MDYEEWYRNHRPTKEELEQQRKEKFSYEPLISILVPVYRTPEEFLMQMIQSVRRQTYGNWSFALPMRILLTKCSTDFKDCFQEG